MRIVFYYYFLFKNLHHHLNKMDGDLTEVFKILFLEESHFDSPFYNE